MALYHFHADLIRRSAGQSVVAASAYRAGEKLHSDYYGDDADYTRKGGIICSEILLPPRAPPEYADRQTLWNAVEEAERGKKAQLAYSYDIALQNELTMDENIALARKFLSEQFVSRGMIVDFAIHAPDSKDGCISNPHFHVLCPIRPLDENGKWGAKQHRVYELDDHGNRVLDDAGNYVFNAIPTTDWGQKETLLHWRAAWANYVNEALEQKGLPCRIDHRSYAEQGIDQRPTIHEGPTVRAMETKGIHTNVGDLNRWIQSTNAALQKLRKKIKDLLAWLDEVHEKLSRPSSPNLVDLLNDYYDQRNAGAWSNKAKVGNLKKLSQQVIFLEQHNITTLDDLALAIVTLDSKANTLNDSMKEKSNRRKVLTELINAAEKYAEMKPVVDGLRNVKFKKSREKYKEEHRREFTIYYAARRTLDKLLTDEPDQKLRPKAWRTEREQLETEYQAVYKELKPLREELKQMQGIQTAIDSVTRNFEHSYRRNEVAL